MNEHSFTTQDCLALAERSPAAVAVHDRQAWLALFAADGVVEDPVGSRPHINRRKSGADSDGDSDPLGRFYDMFITPNDIRFLVDRDIVCGLHVVRDLSLEISMSAGVSVCVPMHLLYELVEEGGELRIARLAAHWELRPMLRQQMALRWANIRAGSASFFRMLRHLGIGGIAGFMRALSTVGEQGKRQVDLFAQHFNAQDRDAFLSLFSSKDIAIDAPYGAQQMTPGQLLASRGELSFGKMLAAGNVVSASFTCRTDDNTHQGVAFFTLDRHSLYITAMKLYW